MMYVMNKDIRYPMAPERYLVERMRKETQDVFTFELRCADDKDKGFQFAPGQFNMLYIFGKGEVPISISGSPSDTGVIVHTVRVVGKVTDAMSRVRRGDVIGVRGPFGRPWPVEEAKGSDVVLVAGGIGLAPLRPTLYHILSQREKYGKIILLYGARVPGDLLYKREIEQWRGRFDLYVDVTVNSAAQDWKGNVGVVTSLISRAQFDPFHTVVMMCGPEIMMRFTLKEFQGMGISDEKIFLSMERNMKCGIGLCGHCQYGPTFICKDGPVFSYADIKHIFGKREI